MELAAQSATAAPMPKRYSVAIGFGALAIVYLAILLSGRVLGRAAENLNDVVWTAMSAATAWICWRASRRMPDKEQRAWKVIALGCASWFLGQLVWDYYDVYVGKLPIFPHWMQALYMLYPVALIVGMLNFPKPEALWGFNVRRAGNMGLLVCTLAIVLIVVITEPAAKFHRPLSNIVGSLIHGGVYPLACVIALYLLWSYRWQHAHWPLLSIIVGLTFHTMAYISDVHHRMVGTYSAASWMQISWIVSFAGTACAAREHGWSLANGAPKDMGTILVRERWVEAVMPALMGLTIALVLVMNIEWISPRVITMCASVGVAFAIILGIREAWTQHEEHRLIAALNESRDRLLALNVNLKRSEQEVRTLNAELEARVAERTKELEAAYRELESFSYAVAHDIKAPLRAVNAFGTLLIEEHGAQLEDKARNYVDRMRRGALHMSQLVDDLLAYAHVERLELQTQTIDISDIIQACVAEQRDEATRLGATVTVDIEHAQVNVDSAALKLALRNLLQNALKFSAHAVPPQVSIEAKHHDSKLLISFRDNGIGFDMQYVDRIFALFQRLHRPDEYSGTGIGLAIARKAIERMNGRIWAESRPSAGASFFVELPLAPSK